MSSKIPVSIVRAQRSDIDTLVRDLSLPLTFSRNLDGQGHLTSSVQHHLGYHLAEAVQKISLEKQQRHSRFCGTMDYYLVLNTIATDPSYGSRGVGTELLNWVQDFWDDKEFTCWMQTPSDYGDFFFYRHCVGRSTLKLDLAGYRIDHEGKKSGEKDEFEWSFYTFP
ncbi:hypothetical protein MMC28_005667 [Mycoblastus sanguinarius]|nr:hypothetical protein [Mycoblastus sanguinarius]